MGRCALVVLILACLVRAAGATAVESLNEAGKAAYTRGDYANAERLFARAIELQPREPLLHYHHAVALTQLGRWHEAFRSYEAVLDLNPPTDIASASRKAMRDLAGACRIARHSPGAGRASRRAPDREWPHFRPVCPDPFDSGW